jgi:hypothetical protein
MIVAIAQRLDRHATMRMIAAGGVWGLTLAAGFFALNASQCGLPCPADLAVTTIICIATGIVTIGPLAAFTHS